jgi:16S rRNA C1402 (ribose-2'-O) methylase RsmI
VRGWQWRPVNRRVPDHTCENPRHIRTLLRHRDIREGMIQMSEEAEKARQALQESMDLREQGHSDD